MEIENWQHRRWWNSLSTCDNYEESGVQGKKNNYDKSYPKFRAGKNEGSIGRKQNQQN